MITKDEIERLMDAVADVVKRYVAAATAPLEQRIAELEKRSEFDFTAADGAMERQAKSSPIEL